MLARAARLLDGTPLAAGPAWTDLRAHALDVFPNECLGYVDQAGLYHQLMNTAAEPEKHAVPDKRVLVTLLAEGRLRALCHSHPGGPDCPSESDGRAQIELEVPFVIVSTNGQATAEPFAFGDQLLDDAPLIGRPFRHYEQDCYRLIRLHWWRERGELLGEYPRNWQWWHPDCPGEKDLYRRHFADEGFRVIAPGQVHNGDLFIAAVPFRDSAGRMFRGVLNHAGVFVESGLALHHPTSGLPYDPSRLSKREPIARMLPWIKEGGNYWLRRD